MKYDLLKKRRGNYNLKGNNNLLNRYLKKRNIAMNVNSVMQNKVKREKEIKENERIEKIKRIEQIKKINKEKEKKKKEREKKEKEKKEKANQNII